MSFLDKDIVLSRTHLVKLSHSTGYQLSKSLRVLSVVTLLSLAPSQYSSLHFPLPSWVCYISARHQVEVPVRRKHMPIA